MRRKWTDEEKTWLILNYSILGIDKCAEHLNRSRAVIKNYAGKLNLYLSSKWTDDKNKFIIDNYAIMGSDYCAKALNKTRNSVMTQAQVLGVRVCTETKIKLMSKPIKTLPSQYNINPEFFIKCETPKVAYILGLLWADGNIQNYKNIYKISISCAEYDLSEILDSFTCMGKWSVINYTPKRGERFLKPILCISTNNRLLFNFLKENDYHLKSGTSADKILSHIPKSMHPYFFRGLLDGDGCWFCKKYKKYYVRQTYITSTYAQDWGFVEKLYDKLNIKYSIYRTIDKKTGNKRSNIVISNKCGIKKLYDYIYYENPTLGFSRKYKNAYFATTAS